MISPFVHVFNNLPKNPISGSKKLVQAFITTVQLKKLGPGGHAAAGAEQGEGTGKAGPVQSQRQADRTCHLILYQ